MSKAGGVLSKIVAELTKKMLGSVEVRSSMTGKEEGLTKTLKMGRDLRKI
jgi:hypothetical protein